MLAAASGLQLHSRMDRSQDPSRPAALATLLASYASYHRDPRNRGTHFLGVPLITFSLMLALSLPTLSRLGFRLELDRIATVALALFYLYLDLPLGLALTVALALLLGAAESAVPLGTAHAGEIAAASFVAGWLLQLLGHRLEGNQPALLENLRQIFIAPIYLMAELAFTLGLRRELRAQIHRSMAASAPAP